MSYFDVFNGDADGICSLLQLRLANPLMSVLITGVKRDIELLQQVPVQSDANVVVLDISMAKNSAPLAKLLDVGASVFYCDHHDAGDIPSVDNLQALINLDANVCTSLLINGHLKGQYAEWAIVGAFGDNLDVSARAVAKPLQLEENYLKQLQQLGILINYNGYGAALEDLHFYPEVLYKEMLPYATPREFLHSNKTVFERLDNGYQQDMAQAENAECLYKDDKAAVFILPDEKWARRVSGVYSNDLTQLNPERAHAVFTELGNDDYLVSVRAPLTNKQGAVDICKQFETGGGRAAAAGINQLPKSEVERFIAVFTHYYR